MLRGTTRPEDLSYDQLSMTATHRTLGQTGYQPTDPPRVLVQLRADIPYLTRFVLLRQLADTVVSEAFFGINDDLESTATHTLQTTQRIIEILCEEGLSSNALSTLNKAREYHRELGIHDEHFRHAFLVLATSMVFWVQDFTDARCSSEDKLQLGLFFSQMANAAGIFGISSDIDTYQCQLDAYRRTHPLGDNPEGRAIVLAMNRSERRSPPSLIRWIGQQLIASLVGRDVCKSLGLKHSGAIAKALACYIWRWRGRLRRMRIVGR